MEEIVPQLDNLTLANKASSSKNVLFLDESLANGIP